jgi:hypothetical protein
MLVDLGRNDVGKVAEHGSVNVERLMDIERYSHVMHISSTVTGKLKEGLTSWDAMRSALPAGTISGAPKARIQWHSTLSLSPCRFDPGADRILLPVVKPCRSVRCRSLMS